MVSVKEAQVVTDRYRDMKGKECVFYRPLFDSDETERAEAIAKALKGLDVATAQGLLRKIGQYLMMAEIR